MNTKEKILDAALTLFSENGFRGTSVEQIARLVGIKAPSLYKHFKSKEEILNAIIDSAEKCYEESFGSERNIGLLPQSKDEFIQITMKKVLFTMRDPMIRKMRMLQTQEQYRNARFAELATWHQLYGIQEMYAKLIGLMMKTGLFKKDDPELLAIELTAPAVLQISRADRYPDSTEECLNCVEKHLKHFCNIYMTTKEF